MGVNYFRGGWGAMEGSNLSGRLWSESQKVFMAAIVSPLSSNKERIGSAFAYLRQGVGKV